MRAANWESPTTSSISDDEAMEQFEALQTIDPDDLAAHYNLAVLYRRMGMKDKAAEQAALFATKQVDPGAPTYSLEFLRKHPEISTESVPWHMHTDMPHPRQAPSGGRDNLMKDDVRSDRRNLSVR